MSLGVLVMTGFLQLSVQMSHSSSCARLTAAKETLTGAWGEGQSEKTQQLDYRETPTLQLGCYFMGQRGHLGSGDEVMGR